MRTLAAPSATGPKYAAGTQRKVPMTENTNPMPINRFGPNFLASQPAGSCVNEYPQ